ncbi:hypothetical protein DFH28DRAFT_937222 [Melampsora americana]|nr:hypothetical protein DFH28DRAFT_937222 [Melampsora americana]
MLTARLLPTGLLAPLSCCLCPVWHNHFSSLIITSTNLAKPPHINHLRTHQSALTLAMSRPEMFFTLTVTLRGDNRSHRYVLSPEEHICLSPPHGNGTVNQIHLGATHSTNPDEYQMHLALLLPRSVYICSQSDAYASVHYISSTLSDVSEYVPGKPDIPPHQRYSHPDTFWCYTPPKPRCIWVHLLTQSQVTYDTNPDASGLAVYTKYNPRCIWVYQTPDSSHVKPMKFRCI